MKTIRIFLASSEELTDDRNAFGNLVRRLDKVYEKRGVQIELFEWEDYDAAYNNRRKQDEYNDQIKASDMFLALFHTKAGRFTIEEFDVATEEFRQHASPKIYTYCKDLAEGDVESPELTEFKRRLFDEMGHYWSRYNNRDTMQLHFVMQLQLVETSGSIDKKLEVENGMVTMSGMPIAKIDNLQFAAENKDFQKKKEEFMSLPDEIEMMQAMVDAHPDQEKYKILLQKKKNQYASLKEELEAESKLMLDFAMTITKLQGEYVTIRMKRAIDAFNIGHIHEAKVILSEAEYDSKLALDEYLQTEKLAEKQRQVVIISIGEMLLKISAIMADLSMPINERIEQTLGIYRQCDETAKKINYEPKQYERFLNQYGSFLYTYAKYDSAISVLERQLTIIKSQYSDKHPYYAIACNNIGMTYWRKGKTAPAVDWISKSLFIKQRYLSKTHPEIAISHINLGCAYNDWGLYDAALEHLQEAKIICEAAFGYYHSYTASVYNNIAFAYFCKNDFETSLSFHRKAIEIREKVLGGNHPETAISYNSVGVIYRLQGKYSEALECYNKALEIQLDTLGFYHPDTAKSANNIGALYLTMQDYENATKICKEALKVQEAILAPLHVDTATTHLHLAQSYEELGDLDNALKHYLKSVESFEQKLGTEHEYTVFCYSKIMDIYFNRRDVGKVIEYYNKAFLSYCSIGEKFEEQGKSEDALDNYNKMLSLTQKVLGEEHGNTASTYCRMASVFRGMKDYINSIEYYKRASDIYSKSEGETTYLATLYNVIGNLFVDKGDYSKALEYYLTAQPIFENELGPDHPDTKTVRENIENTRSVILKTSEDKK